MSQLITLIEKEATKREKVSQFVIHNEYSRSILLSKHSICTSRCSKPMCMKMHEIATESEASWTKQSENKNKPMQITIVNK